MRGDSLRDLYAKTLALLGLGVLAGTGALVDYWPVGRPLPAVVGSPLAPAVVLGPIASASVGEPQKSAVPARLATSRPSPRASSTARPWSPPPLTVGTFSAAVVDATPVWLGQPGRLDELDEPVLNLSSVTEILLDSAEPVLVSADASAVFGESTAAPPVLLSEAPDEGEGLLTSAFKRTGTSIVKTGARTGASIFDAVRVVSGMVRRALPTN